MAHSPARQLRSYNMTSGSYVRIQLGLAWKGQERGDGKPRSRSSFLGRLRPSENRADRLGSRFSRCGLHFRGQGRADHFEAVDLPEADLATGDKAEEENQGGI